MTSVLHITNGDSAVAKLDAAGITGKNLPWRDILHDGPCPQVESDEELIDIRAAYIASCGWAEVDDVRRSFLNRLTTLKEAVAQGHEINLWFEHDLYDQLQLIQILAWIKQNGASANVHLINPDTHLAYIPNDDYRALHKNRQAITPQQYDLAIKSWSAFSASDPGKLLQIYHQNNNALPWLNQALHRWFQEYPSKENGLSRSQQQILHGLAAGHSYPGALFRATGDMEEAAWCGDSSFWRYLQSLMATEHAAVALTSGQPFKLPQPPFPDQAFNQQELQLTDIGRQLIAGKLHWADIAIIDRWMGGVQLKSNKLYCWDEDEKRLEMRD